MNMTPEDSEFLRVFYLMDFLRQSKDEVRKKGELLRDFETPINEIKKRRKIQFPLSH